MSSYEFSVWIAEYAREPWGEGRADLRAAMIATTVANYAGRSRKEPARLSDFMLNFERDEEIESDPLEHFEMMSR